MCARTHYPQGVGSGGRRSIVVGDQAVTDDHQGGHNRPQQTTSAQTPRCATTRRIPPRSSAIRGSRASRRSEPMPNARADSLARDPHPAGEAEADGQHHRSEHIDQSTDRRQMHRPGVAAHRRPLGRPARRVSGCLPVRARPEPGRGAGGRHADREPETGGLVRTIGCLRGRPGRRRLGAPHGPTGRRRLGGIPVQRAPGRVRGHRAGGHVERRLRISTRLDDRDAVRPAAPRAHWDRRTPAGPWARARPSAGRARRSTAEPHPDSANWLGRSTGAYSGPSSQVAMQSS